MRSFVLNASFFLTTGAILTFLAVGVVGAWPLIITSGGIAGLLLLIKWGDCKTAYYEGSGMFALEAQQELMLSVVRCFCFALGQGLCEAILFTDLREGLFTTLAVVAISIIPLILSGFMNLLRLKHETREKLGFAIGTGVILIMATEMEKLLGNEFPAQLGLGALIVALIGINMCVKNLQEAVGHLFFYSLPSSLIFFCYLGATNKIKHPVLLWALVFVLTVVLGWLLKEWLAKAKKI